MKDSRVVLIVLLSSIISISNSLSQDPVNAFYIGHSLSDQIPDMVKSLADDHAEVSFDWSYQSIPGAPLRWQWQRKDVNDYENNPPYYYGFYDAEGGLRSGDYNVLVLTESVPRYEELILETYEYADSFYRYANTYNDDIRIFLYEDWHCILSGTPTGCDYDIDSNPWRQRLDDDLEMWESVVDTLNARFAPANPVCLIPAAQGLAQLYDSIEAGVVPILTSIEDIFSDDIHLTDVGKYFVACVHFATIFETSPVGLTNQLQVWWGGDFEAPSAELALKFQEIAWHAALKYPASCSATSTSQVEDVGLENKFKLISNPVTDLLSIDGVSSGRTYQIFNLNGELLLSSSENVIQLGHFPKGLYFISSEGHTVKFLKQ